MRSCSRRTSRGSLLATCQRQVEAEQGGDERPDGKQQDENGSCKRKGKREAAPELEAIAYR